MFETKKLHSVCEIINQSPPQFTGYKQYVATGDLQNSEIISSTNVTYDNRPSRADSILKSGDVIFAKMADTDKALIAGKMHEEMLFSTGFAVLRPMPEILDSRYLYHILRSEKFLSEKNRLSSGATQKAITNKALLGINLPLPPIREQKRIANILDLVEKTGFLSKKIERNMDSIWKGLFQEKIISEVGRYPISRKQHPIGDGWEWVKLVDVAKLESGHTPSRNKPEWWGGDIGWITLGDIRKHDGRTIFSTNENTNPLGIENSSARILPEKTVCFARTASVGFVTIMGKPMATSQDFVNFVCSDRIVPEYLLFAFMASRRWLLSIANGSTHKTIYYPVVKSLYIALPKIETQKIFSELFNSLETLSANFAPIELFYSSLKGSASTELI
jgi:type I restriction enzyme S subunit